MYVLNIVNMLKLPYNASKHIFQENVKIRSTPEHINFYLNQTFFSDKTYSRI